MHRFTRKHELVQAYRRGISLSPEELEASFRRPSLTKDVSGAAAVALIVREASPAGLELLLNLRSKHLKHHSGEVSLPGGRLEQGESPLGALHRELEEELGVAPTCFELEPEPFASLRSLHGLNVSAYLGFLKMGAPQFQCSDEIEDSGWVGVELLFDESLWLRREHSLLEWGGWRHPTWGLTAAFLALFCFRITGQVPLRHP